MAAHRRADTPVNPFDLDDNETYARWRDRKLATYPEDTADLIVEVGDPRSLTAVERQALADRCRKTNMAIYAGRTGTDPDPEIPLAMGRAFGLEEISENWLGEETGLTALKVAQEGVRKRYIPYTTKAINWHTDGYYNGADRQIRALLMHAVQNAESGGENRLMDHEMAFLMLREKDPSYIRALMAADAMTIPARLDEQGEVERKEESGPVFSVNDRGELHMRYTIRVRHVQWRDDPVTQAALGALREILNEPCNYHHRVLLEPGMGLVSNNVLHDRSAFVENEAHPRHYYRARYASRLALDAIDLAHA